MILIFYKAVYLAIELKRLSYIMSFFLLALPVVYIWLQHIDCNVYK